jgi:hypothetical protein
MLQDIHTRQNFDITYIEFSNRLDSLSSLVEEETSPEEFWEKSKTALTETCKKFLRLKTRQHNPCISAQSLGKVKERKDRDTGVNNT